MPRKTRMYLPGVPAHIVQRGNNRDLCFFAEEDYRFYAEVLNEGLMRYQVWLHAYCLMSNHVHLLMTPRDTDGISRVMQHVGRMYVSYVNKTYRRSGTLWEGRHKSSLVDAEHYLLVCYRYIELNPVMAAIVEKPEEYPWSSYRCNAINKCDPMITSHPLYHVLDTTEEGRCARYRELFRHHIPTHDVHDIRSCLAANQVLGQRRFKEQLEKALGHRLGQVRRGRPKKTHNE